jgi:hypothetical protein
MTIKFGEIFAMWSLHIKSLAFSGSSENKAKIDRTPLRPRRTRLRNIALFLESNHFVMTEIICALVGEPDIERTDAQGRLKYCESPGPTFATTL